jgi:hypothetical protein
LFTYDLSKKEAAEKPVSPEVYGSPPKIPKVYSD